MGRRRDRKDHLKKTEEERESARTKGLLEETAQKAN